MTQNEVLLDVIMKLNKLDIVYMLTGAYAVSFHGEPRTTHDIDFNVAIKIANVNPFYESFKDGFYVDDEMIKSAIKNENMFNIIHLESNIKIDFWIVKNDDFDKSRLERRQKDVFFGEPVYLTSPEDTILLKPDWFKKYESEKHYRDASGILRISNDKLDFDYIEEWAEKLNITDVWKRLHKEENP